MSGYPKSHLTLALSLAGVLALLAFALPSQESTARVSEPIPLSVPAKAEPPGPELILPVEPVVEVADTWTHVKVKSGDNLARIFQRNKIPAKTLQEIIDLGGDATSLKRIMPGQELSFRRDAAAALKEIRYQKDAFETLVVTTAGDSFDISWDRAEPERLITYQTGVVTSDKPSLYHAGKAAGLSDNIIMKLSHVFQWDISFALDLRTGDAFTVMYEEIYVDGEKVKEGDIVGATFTNAGDTHRAVRYTDLSGSSNFYTPDGLSMRKAFLRDPVHFSHVSSSFNLRRLHPIHKTVMPHRGIDYAARTGTPVVASGDGKITIRRQNNASGKYVVIQHGEQYTTKYLHLSGFARGIKPGASVKQGQTIGYVGMTGWATGPHLHYEFLVNGVHRNPKTVRLPKASPVPDDELQRFRSSVAPMLAQLDIISGRGLASAGDAGAGE